MKIVVLDGYTLNPGDLSWASLQALGDGTVYERTAAEEIVARSAGAEVLLTNKTPLRRATLEQLPAVRYIGLLATGHDLVDSAYARERGITVTNAPGYSTPSTAQMTIALLLELCHRVGLHDASVKEGEWTKDFSDSKTPQVELAGKTLGLIGYGAIGQAVAKVARALGMRIEVYRRPGSTREMTDADAVHTSVEALFAAADVVSLHCPATPETRGLVNSRTLGLMKETAMLINTARGALVVEQDLADALNAGKIAGAAMDVLQVEPPRGGSPLFTARNCIITPHIAWATRESRQRLMDMVVGNLKAFLEGSPVHVVR